MCSMSESHIDAATFAANFAKIAEQSQVIVQEFMARNTTLASFGTGDPLHISNAFSELFAHIANDPKKAIELQLGLWEDGIKLWHHTMQKFLGEQSDPVIEPDARDRRFKDEAWRESIIFDFIKQSYLLTAR